MDLDALRRAWTHLAAKIRAGDPLDGFRHAVTLLKEIDDLVVATRALRDQQVVRVRDERRLSLAGLADLFSTEAGLEIGRHRVNQMIQNTLDPAEKG